MKELHNDFKISYNEGLELLTVRYNQDGMLEDLSKDRTILLEQRSPITIQRLLK
jgi:aspartate kinase